MSPKSEKPEKPVNPRGAFYEYGTPDEEEAKHQERIRAAKDRKDKKMEKNNAG